MAASLANKNILLGVTGSIAAYKSADLARRLRDAGASVRVVMTRHAKEFITPLTMQAVSGNPVHDDLFDLEAEAAMGHIELARWADVILVAPATADFMARLANGEASDLLTTLCLATKAPIAIAPAMNQGMWSHESTQANLQILRQKQVMVIGPDAGSQACGDVGLGRLLEPATIVDELSALFTTGTLAGLTLVLTAGPTREAIDPVRYLTNGSSGKMGYALATAAAEAGARVVLISGPVNLPIPDHVEFIAIESAQDMHREVMKKASDCDIFLAVAAVADYRPLTMSDQKIHKQSDTMQLALVRNPDIVSDVAQLSERPFVVGFAAETENVMASARSKRERKKMDMIVANQVGIALGIGSDENAVTVIGSTSETTLPLMSKQALARQLIAMIADEFYQQEKWKRHGKHIAASKRHFETSSEG